MTPRFIRRLIRFRIVRFAVDLTDDPVRAWRRLIQKRTWPSPKEFDAMTHDEFVAYLESIGKRRNQSR